MTLEVMELGSAFSETKGNKVQQASDSLKGKVAGQTNRFNIVGGLEDYT